MRPSLYLGILLTLLLLAPAVLAQEPDASEELRGTPRLEQILPDHTFLVASLNDLPSAGRQIGRTALAKILMEPEMLQFLAPGFVHLEREIARLERKVGHPVRGLCGSLAGQAALAVVEFDPMGGNPVPDAVLFADLGEGVAGFREVHDRALADAGDQIRVEKAAHGGIDYQIVTLPMGLDLGVGYLGTALVVTTVPGRMPALIDAWVRGLPNSLAASPTFRAVREHTGGSEAFLSVFVNAESMMGYFAERMDPMTLRIMDLSGMAGIRGLGMGSSFAGAGIRDSFFLYAPGEKAGVLSMFYNAPGDGTALLQNVPRSAFYASAGRMDLEKSMNMVLELLGEVDPYIQEEVLKKLGGIEEQIGIDIRRDLLGPLGDELGLYMAMPDGGGVVPDVVMLCRPEHPDLLLTTLGRLVMVGKQAIAGNHPGMELSIRELPYHGKTIYYVHVAQRRGEPFPVTPCVMMDGDVMVAALYPQVLKDYAARGAKGGSVLERGDFARVRKMLPKDLTSIEYVDFQVMLRHLYGSLVPMAQMLGKNARCPVDVALLPRTETVAKHLFGGIWGMSATEAGVALHAYTPTSLLPMMAASMAPALVMARQSQMTIKARMAPSVRKVEPEVVPPLPVRVKPEPVKPLHSARTQLEEVYIGLLFHFAQTDKYPKSLAAMVASKALPDAKMLTLPWDGAPVAAGGNLKTSFVYVGPGIGDVLKDQDSLIWVHEHDGLAKVQGGRWVLFASGRVGFLKEEAFQEMIGKSTGAAK